MRKQTQNRIRELRKQSRLSQQTLADQIGVFRNTISNWETGYSQISLENAKKVAEYFGVTIDYLLGSESDQTQYR
ncbi:helix-turn-helix transcriptional regulator [Streptococcus anginosus]|uniref:helix-turn-helix transcriptional regulator n=1 Tax=Streptococcus anginosus TaxID=1328 RepID=UPI00124856B0|nr:helix-turn-helix transcriptional regulator [Streptococcus anginosus]KAA9295071.1 helix-turn-helix transcriptional regulator [Streptococcus anginosus]